MEAEGLLSGLRARAPWRTVASPLLRSLGFEVGRGYDDTITENLASGVTDEQEEALRLALIEHLVAGEKLIRLVKLKTTEIDKLREWARSKNPVRNALTEAFPGIAPLGAIRAFDQPEPQYVGAVEVTGGDAALFTSKRSYLERVTLGQDSLKPTTEHEFEKIIGVRRRFVQTYDAILLPSKGRFACIATDFPDDAPHDFAEQSQVALEKSMRRVLGEFAAANLWPAVDGLYSARDGQFVEHGFVTDGESLKHHKSRRRRKDLREDAFFKGGVKVVGDDLLSYRVGVRWTRRHTPSLDSAPELLLPGTSRLLYKANASLEEAIVRGCLNVGDLQFVMSKLAPYL